MTSSDRTRQIITLISCFFAIVAGMPGIIENVTGTSIGAVSNSMPNAFVPAGYAFAIWGLIYLGIGAYGIYQVLPAQRTSPICRTTGWPLTLATLTAGIWGFTFTAGLFGLSVLLIGTTLGALAMAFVAILRLTPLSSIDTWLARVPVSLFFGWITVATIAAVTFYFTTLGWDSPQADLWAAALVVVATTVAGLIIQKAEGDLAYAGVVAWALVAIFIEHGGAQGWLALVAAPALLIFAFYLINRDRSLEAA